MKLTITKKIEVDADNLRLDAYLGDFISDWEVEPFEFGDQEFQNLEEFEKKYPLLLDEQPEDGTRTIHLEINCKTGKVLNWPEGVEYDFTYRKIVDTGYYQLTYNGEVVASRDGYVPECLGHDGYGDYLMFEINKDGYIEDWEFGQDDVCEIDGSEE